MRRSRLLSVDLLVSASVPLLGVWLYEISNWIVLIGQGYTVSLSTAGGVPLGVAGVSTGVISPLTKTFQVAISIILLVPLGALFSRAGLLVAKIFVTSTIAIYLASAYWEMLSLLSVVSIAVHSGIFIAVTSALAIVLFRGVSRHNPPLTAPPATGVRRAPLALILLRRIFSI